MKPLQKKIEIGSYEIEVYPEETKEQYEKNPKYAGENDGVRYFQHLLPKAEKESVAFLKSLGIDPEKISVARPLTAPDEKGEILYLCTDRFCGKVLIGVETQPRQSEEIAGISVVFIGKEKDFTPGMTSFLQPEAEIRFVIPLPFDPSFFE